MTKKKPKKRKIIAYDFEIAISGIIPSTRKTRKDETESIKIFRNNFLKVVLENLESNQRLPTQSQVFVYIQQYFVSQKQYDRRDVDNFSKTILDMIKENLIVDDAQVRTLLVSKKVDPRISQNFAYIALKEIKNDRDIEALKVSNIDRSVELFNEAQRRGGSH